MLVEKMQKEIWKNQMLKRKEYIFTLCRYLTLMQEPMSLNKF